MRGAAELTCQRNKKFDYSAPECEVVDCGMPPELPNSIRNGKTTALPKFLSWSISHLVLVLFL